MKFNILLVDDELELPILLEDYKNEYHYNYELKHISCGSEMMEILQNEAVHLIVLDWSLSNELCGLDLLKQLKSRKATEDIYVIFLTKDNSLNEEILALNSGADLFLTKPINFDLLFAYINTILRRVDKKQTAQNILLKKFIFSEESRQLEYKGELHSLTTKEFTILKTLVDNPGRTFSQRELNALSSGPKIFITKRCIDTYVTNLRHKIGKDSILSIKKKGYTINPRLFEDFE